MKENNNATDTNTTNNVIIVGGGKGGVGKSTVTMAVVDSLIKSGHKVLLIESDNSNPDTYKPLKEIVTCELCNLDNESGFIKLGNIIEKNKASFIVINTAARLTDEIIKYGSSITDVVNEQGRKLIMLWPINRQRDSLELLKKFLDKSKGYHATYVALNTYFGAEEKFARYNASEQKSRVKGTIVFPELNDLVADKIVDNRLALSNADAWRNENDKLSIAERSALRRYREDAQEALKVVYE